MKQQVELLIAGVIALVLVFAPRPVPIVSDLLANPLGQLLALGGVILVGAYHSLLLAVLLGAAFVLLVPGREFADDASMKPKCKKGESYNAKSKKCEPTVPPKKAAAPAPASKSDAKSEPPAAAPAQPKPAAEETLETFMSGAGISYAPY